MNPTALGDYEFDEIETGALRQMEERTREYLCTIDTKLNLVTSILTNPAPAVPTTHILARTCQSIPLKASKKPLVSNPTPSSPSKHLLNSLHFDQKFSPIKDSSQTTDPNGSSTSFTQDSINNEIQTKDSTDSSNITQDSINNEIQTKDSIDSPKLNQ
jgi:hypothetical protein